MTRTLTLLCPALTFAAFVLGPVAHARTLQQIRTSGTLRLTTEGAFPPFNFFQGKALVGFEVALGNALARRLKAAWGTQPFDGLLIGLKQGRYDTVIASHAITLERQQAVNFLHPHSCSTVNIVAKRGEALTKAALAGKTVGTQIGTAQIPILQAIPRIKDVRTSPNDQAVLTALQAGRLDARSSHGPVAAYMLKQIGAQGRVVIGDAISRERNAGAVAGGNAALRDALNTAMTKLQTDGTYAALSKKWFGQDIGCR